VDNVESVDNNQLSLFDEKTTNQGLTVKKKKKRQTLNIPINRAIVEINLFTLPLGVLGKTIKTENGEIKPKDAGEIIVSWNDSDGVERGIRILGSDTYGVLTYFDVKVLIGLFKLYSEQNAVIQYDFKTETYGVTNKINFTFSELARAMKYTTAGKNLKKLQDSIRRISAIKLMNVGDGAIYDPTKKMYIKAKAEKSYNILDHEMCRYEMFDENEKRPNATEIRENNFVIIDEFFFNSLCKGYGKIIEYDLYLSLKSDITCRVYSLLEGWCGKKKIDMFRYYDTFYNLIPLDKNSSVSVKNRYIRDAADELKEVGYIQGYEIEDRENGRGIRFIFNYSEYEAQNIDIYGLEKYKTEEEVIIVLRDNGISNEKIEQSLRIKEFEYIKALLRYYDVQMKYDKITKNPKRFLEKGLETPYNIDQKYYNK
jgi:hypothetical protein